MHKTVNVTKEQYFLTKPEQHVHALGRAELSLSVHLPVPAAMQLS